MRRSRRRGQSVVEFGIIAILFTLIMFAIADFGLLLNDWLSVSSAARTLARDAAIGTSTSDLVSEAKVQAIAGVGGDPYFSGQYCCQVPGGSYPNGAAVQLIVTYYKQCVPPVSNCDPIGPGDEFDSRFASNDPTNPSIVTNGSCTKWSLTPPVPCQHPAPPATRGNCFLGSTTPCPGDVVVLTLKAAGAQVITPLVRPFFAGPACPDTSTPSHCYVALSSSVTMRFEGDVLF